MSKPKSSVTEKLDVESLIVDLLACGLGACVILFFIFSIKIIAKTNVENKSTDNNQLGKGSGYVSLLGDDGNKNKRMGSVRIIEFSVLSEENFDVIKKYALASNSDFWDDFKKFRLGDKEGKKLMPTIKSQFQYHRDNLSFIVYADGMRELNFSFPTEVKNKLANTRKVNGRVQVFALEGRSVKGDFNGAFRSIPFEIADLKQFKISIKVGRTTRIDKLIKIQETQ